MPRWATTREEQIHVARISQNMPIGGIVLVELSSGAAPFQAVLRGERAGNNAGQGGVWKYYGEIDVETLSGERHTLDYFDLKNVTRVSDSAVMDMFHRAGLITFRDLPN